MHTLTGYETDGQYLYITAYNKDGLEIVDISDPANPVLVTQYDNTLYEFSMTYSDDLIYIGTNNNVLSIVDIHDKSAPAELSRLTLTHTSRILSAWEGYLCASDFGEFSVIDISDPSQPRTLWTVNDWSVKDVFIHNGLVYVFYNLQSGVGFVGVRVYDLYADEPTVVSDIPLRDNYSPRFSASDDHVLLTFGPSVLMINADDRNNIFVEAEYPVHSGRSAATVDNYMYTVCDGLLRITDISNPTPYSRISRTTHAQSLDMTEILQNGNYLYITNYNNGMMVFDITDRDFPQFVTHYTDTIPTDLNTSILTAAGSSWPGTDREYM